MPAPASPHSPAAATNARGKSRPPSLRAAAAAPSTGPIASPNWMQLCTIANDSVLQISVAGEPVADEVWGYSQRGYDFSLTANTIAMTPTAGRNGVTPADAAFAR